MRESGPYALLFLYFFIAMVSWSLVNDSAFSRDITSALHPSTPDESSSMKSAFPARSGELAVETVDYQLG